MKIEKLNELIEKQYAKKNKEHEEIFKKIFINGHESSYSVSNLGNVRNDKFKRPLKPMKCGSGHLHVELYMCGKSKRFLIHKLVAEYFCDNRGEKYMDEVHHIDSDRENNAYWNLIWCSSKEHREIHKQIGYYNPVMGDNHPSTKIKDEVINNIFIDMSNGMSNKDIALKYNLNPCYISLLRSGKMRKNISNNYDITPMKKISRIKGLYDIDMIEKAAIMIADGKTNKEITECTGLKKDTLNRLRTGEQHRDMYEKYNLNLVQKKKIRMSDEKLDLMTKMIIEGNLSTKEISEKLKIPYETIYTARCKIKKGKYKRALKFIKTFND